MLRNIRFLLFSFVLIMAASTAYAGLGASVSISAGEETNIFPGETTVLEITLSNNNIASAINSVSFSNSLPGVLPDGLKISGAAGYTCFDPSDSSTNPGAGTVTANLDSQSISLSSGVIPERANSNDGTCTITIPVTAGTSDGVGTGYTYTIADGAVTGDDGVVVANSGAVSQSINIRALVLPVVTKAFGAETVFVGGASTTLTINVTNPNAINIAGFGITDNFPVEGPGAIIRVADTPSATSVCTGGGVAPAFTPSSGDVSVSASGGTIAAGESCTLTVQVTGRQTNSKYETEIIENTIIGATDFASDIGLQPENAIAEIRSRSPIRVAKAFASSTLASGQQGSFTITFSNDGDGPITINSFTDSPIDGTGNLSFGLKLVGTPTMTCSGSGVAGTFANTANDVGFSQTSNSTIAASGSCSITGDFIGTIQTANTPRTYTNTIAQGSVGFTDAGIINQGRSAAIIVVDDLRITKTSTPAQVAPGNPIRYFLSTQNYNTSAISDITINDALSNGQTFLTGVINGIDYTPALSGSAGCSNLVTLSSTGDSIAQFTLDTIPARTGDTTPGSCTVAFYAMTSDSAADNAAISNSIGAGDVCYNSGANCNGGGASAPTRRINTEVLEIEKTFSPEGPLPENSVVTMRFELFNLSATPLTSAAISDNLPAAAVGSGQMRIANVPNAATTCGAATFTAVAGATSFAMNGGVIPARASNGSGDRGSCTVQVDVIAPAGVYNNTAIASATGNYANGSSYSVTPVNDTESITYNSTLSASKSFSPSAVSNGGQSIVRVRLNNSGPVALTNVSVTDPLPAGMVLANPVNAASTCAGSANFSGSAGASSITVTGAEIPGSGSCEILFNVAVSGATDWENIIPVGNITADGGINNQEPIEATLVNSAPQGVAVSKTTAPSTLTFPGQTSKMNITLTNGSTAVTNVSLSDFFTSDGLSGSADNGMVLSSSPTVSTNCRGAIVTANSGGKSVAAEGISLNANEECEITFNVTLTSAGAGGVTNVIPAGALVSDEGLTNNSQAATSLTTQSNIGITKQFTPSVIQPGTRSRLRLTFFNPTSQPASSIQVTDTMPAGITIPAGANPVTTCAGGTATSSGNQFSVSGATMPASSGGQPETCFAEIDVFAAAQGDYENIIPAGDLTASIGGAAVTNVDPAADTLRVKTGIVVNKAFDSRTLDAGNPAGYTTGVATRKVGEVARLSISLSNPNSENLTQAFFTDSLPSGLVIAQTPNASTTCANGSVTAAASASSIRLTGGTIPASGSCEIAVDVLSNISNVYLNTISAGKVTTFEGVTNDEATNAQIIIANAPTVSKEFSPPVIGAGGTSTVTIFLGNDNDAAATLTSAFNDNLPTAPGSVVVAATPNIVKTCPGSVVANAGASGIVYVNGASVPSGGCSISFDVTANTPGDYVNTIPAGELQTNFGNNQQPANAPLSVSTLGYVTGKVFRDNGTTPNGIFEGGDSAIESATIELKSGANCSGAALATQTTDSAGNYLFTGLSAGTYSVCQAAQPSGTLNSIATAGSIVSSNGSTGSVGSASNPTSTSSQIVNIILNGDGAGGEISGSTGNNFSEVVGSTISGTVFLDDNNNGVKNGSDAGVATLAIQLLDAGGSVIQTTNTDSDGNYSFEGLAPGTYSVRQPTQPADSSNGLTIAGSVGNGGTAGTATTTTVTPSQITDIILPPNTSAVGNNFAEIPNSRAISGTVFLDYNDDRLLNNSDYGLSGVTINLSGSDSSGNAVNDSAITDANGNYEFTGLASGTYVLDQLAQPANTTNGTATAGSAGGAVTSPTADSSRISAINLSGLNVSATGNNFAEVPGAAPDLTIGKTHAPVSFGENSSTGVFAITVQNAGSVDTSGTVTVVDTLPAGMTIAEQATGTGWSCSGAVGETTVTCTTDDVIAAASSANPIRLRVIVENGRSGQLLVNNVTVSGGGEPAEFNGNNSASDTVAISDSARLSGTVWEDTDHDRVLDAGEERKAGWTVELLLDGNPIRSTLSDTNGEYTFDGISPGSGYEVRFRDPINNVIFGRPVTNEQGISTVNNTRDTSNNANNGTNSGNPSGADLADKDGRIKSINLIAGDNIVEQSLPLDPAGVVYDSATRNPIAGAVVTITGPAGFNPTTDLVGGSATFTTGADGMYQFLLTPTAPVGDYTLEITTYPGGYIPLPSTQIPVCNNVVITSPAPNPALIHINATAPTLAAPIHDPLTCPAATSGLNAGNQASTQHYFRFTIDVSSSADILNNHIPLDPLNPGDIVVTKTSSLVSVNVGQLVPYTVEVANTTPNNFGNIDVIDNIPPGFKYKVGSSTLNGAALEPTVTGRTLTWPAQPLTGSSTLTFKMLLVVGTGVQPGEYTNTAQAFNSPATLALSNLGTATVRVIPDPLFDCSEIIGKVFDDENSNGYQDQGEAGLGGVKLATLNGLLVTTDDKGRFHVACAIIPDAERGSNFLMKVDERTLPSGYRITTENPRSVRATRGKMTKINFGAAIHKVVRIDMNQAAFEGDSQELKQEWKTQLEKLFDTINDKAIVFRISYVAQALEGSDLAKDRLSYATEYVEDLAEEKTCCSQLQIEQELLTKGSAQND